MTRIALILVTVAAYVTTTAAPSRPTGGGVTAVVVDAQTHAPLSDAIVTSDVHEMRTDARGTVRVEASTRVFGVRAYGYERRAVDGAVVRHGATIELKPFRPKALYLSMFGAGSRSLRGAALHLADTTEINALVIDVKGDRGYVAYRSGIATAAQVGAQKVITLGDLAGLVAPLHQRGLYLIARVVVFKDDLLASARPDLAVHRRDGSIFHDRERLAWTDPFNREVWDYNIAVAAEAARAGFDEVQFDYVRLPDAQGLALPAQTQASRRAAITGFLAAARRALAPYNVFVAADVFGYVCWNTDDTGIGQHLDNLVSSVDYVSPMLYPSSFQFGIPGYRNPVQHPYDIVRRSLEEALDRTRVPPARFRPWLQAFADYAFRGGSFRSGEVRIQIKAAEDVGTNGWMLWNPRNQYSAADLRP